MPSVGDSQRVPLAPLVPFPGGSSSGPRPARATGIVVVDPVPLFVEGLCGLLNRTPSVRVLGVAATPQAGLALCERMRPDVVLLDAVLDPRCQFGRLLSLPVRGKEAPTILSVVREPLRHPRYLATAAAAGVPGFVLRSAEPARMVEAIRRTHLQRRFLDPDLSALAGAPALRAVGSGSTSSRQPLSRREQEVLRLVAEGMENQEIATALFVSVETIRTHVKSILRKLHARDRAHAVALAFRLGLLAPQIAAQPGEATPADTPSSGRGHVAGTSLARVTSR